MLENMKIGSRIALALVLPIVGLLFFSGYSIYDKNIQSSQMTALQELAAVAPYISNVSDNLQKERGISAVFIGSKGQKFAQELPAQQSKTDAALGVLTTTLKTLDTEAFAPALSTKLNTAFKALSELGTKRDGIKGFNLSVPQMAKYYTLTTAKLLSIIEEMAVISNHAQVTKSFAAYTSFLQAKERAGQERAMGGGGFGAGQFSPPVYRRMTELIAEQNIFMSTFAIYASDSMKATLKETVKGPDIDEVNRMRKIAIDSIYTNTTEGIEGPYWFKTITRKIEMLKKVEDSIVQELESQASAIKADTQMSFYLFLIATVVLLVVTAGLVYVIVTGITRPIVGLTFTMRTLADGDTSVHLSGTQRGDEIGSMSQAVEVFKENMITNAKMATAKEKEDAVKEQQRIAVENMARQFETDVSAVLAEVSQASNSMQGTAESMAATAEETSKQSTVVAAAAEEASTNVQTVASAAEELSSSISEISRQVSQSTKVAGAAVTEVEGANDKVQGLANAANKIGEVVALITDIADQTNLLALNATIEAARAGEAGKGFAVVASEVKNLANQTAKATEEISTQINAIQGATEDAVHAIGSIGGTIGDMNEIASTIAAAVEEQGAATQEIARNVEQAAAGTGEVTANITGVNQAANDTGQAAEMVLGAVNTLTAQSDSLRDQVESFLTGLKSV